MGFGNARAPRDCRLPSAVLRWLLHDQYPWQSQVPLHQDGFAACPSTCVALAATPVDRCCCCRPSGWRGEGCGLASFPDVRRTGVTRRDRASLLDCAPPIRLESEIREVARLQRRSGLSVRRIDQDIFAPSPCRLAQRECGGLHRSQGCRRGMVFQSGRLAT